ncbi:MAG: hypothetical protein R6X32_23710 [Chloroflexota bacterium]
MYENDGRPRTDDGVGLSVFGHFAWLSAGSSSSVLFMCCLAALPPSGFSLHAVPVKVRRFGTFPVRVYAIGVTEAG